MRLVRDVANSVVRRGLPYLEDAPPQAITGAYQYLRWMGTRFGLPLPPALKPHLDAYRDIYRSYQPEDARYLANHRGHLMFLRPEEEANISDAVIRALTFTGTKAELVDGVRAIEAAGYSQFGFQVRNGHEMAMLEDWADVVAKV